MYIYICVCAFVSLYVYIYICVCVPMFCECERTATNILQPKNSGSLTSSDIVAPSSKAMT